MEPYRSLDILRTAMSQILENPGAPLEVSEHAERALAATSHAGWMLTEDIEPPEGQLVLGVWWKVRKDASGRTLTSTSSPYLLYRFGSNYQQIGISHANPPTWWYPMPLSPRLPKEES